MTAPPVLNKEGKIRQCNQGDYEFRFWDDEEKDLIFLEVEVPKFMGTQVIEADV